MYGQPQFDQHQFVHRVNAVTAETEISFQDFGRMHVYRRSQHPQRRLPTPQWAMNDEQLRAVVLRSAEDRFYLRSHSGTDAERMARITAEEQRRLPVCKAQLDDMLKFYAKHQMEHLPIQIQNKDTECQCLQRGVVKLATALVYRYYRNGFTCVQVAEDLGLRPPHVRRWLYVLHTVANRLGFSKGPKTRNSSTKYQPKRSMHYLRGVRKWTPALAAEFLAYRKAGHSFRKCAVEFGMKRPQDAWAAYARLTGKR